MPQVDLQPVLDALEQAIAAWPDVAGLPAHEKLRDQYRGLHIALLNLPVRIYAFRRAAERVAKSQDRPKTQRARR